MKVVSNLTRVTGMGVLPAQAFLKACVTEELAMLESGKVQEALSAKSLREAAERAEKEQPTLLQQVQEATHQVTVAYAAGHIPEDVRDKMHAALESKLSDAAGTPSDSSPAESVSEADFAAEDGQ